MTESSTAPIFLIGYRGTGKSTVARLLAERSGYEFVDSDDEVERRAGKSIAAIFVAGGESAFRAIETQVVAESCRRTRTVVSLGGGAVLLAENREQIRAAAGVVIWLTADVATIVARLAADSDTAARRPNLTATGGQAEIEAILAERTPIYRACATLVVDTERKTPAEIVGEIVTQLAQEKQNG